jgi:hypothetical protein
MIHCAIYARKSSDDTGRDAEAWLGRQLEGLGK